MPLPLPSKLPTSPLLLTLLLLTLPILFSFRHPHSSRNTPLHSQNTPPKTLFLSLSQASNASISSHLRSLTRGPHLAGTPQSLAAAAYVLSHFQLSGLETLAKNYTPLLSYPKFSSLTLLHPNLTLAKPLSLSEPADPTGKFVVPYHAYSPSGSAVAAAVYVNYGREKDYAKLNELGVTVKDCIVIVRRGEGPRGTVVELAAERGAKAVLMFGEKAEGGVERGTAVLGGPGDPLTPGWTADEGGERLRVEDEEVRRRFPRIPSMPLSLSAAREISRGFGGPRVPEEWRGEVVGEWGGVGGGPSLLNFTYQVNFAIFCKLFSFVVLGESELVVYLN